MQKNFLIVDVETCGRDECRPWVRPDPRLVDPKKIEASLEERCDKLAVDVNGARIVALGVYSSLQSEPFVMLCEDEAQERAALGVFWLAWVTLPAHSRRIVGFCARRFDVPLIIRRSQLLNVSSAYVSLARYGKGDVLDVYEELCFHDTFSTGVVPRDMETFCRLFCIDVTDNVDGAEVPALVAAGEWEKIRLHNLADLLKTYALARRLELIGPHAFALGPMTIEATPV